MAREAHQVVRLSPFSGITHTKTIVFDLADYRRWQKGELIQNAMPYLTADEREYLMTGITKDEWDSAFGGSHGTNHGEDI